MSVQWHLVFGIMTFEVLFFMILCLPLPISWRHGLLRYISDKPSGHPIVRTMQFVFLFMSVLFVDTCVKLSKNISKEDVLRAHPQQFASEHFFHMQLFLSQRNFYLCFFTLLMLAVIWQVKALFAEIIKSQALLKQAHNSSEGYEMLLKEKADNAPANKEMVKELADTKKELADAQAACKKAEIDLVAMKKQSDNFKIEYERLLKLSQEMQDKLEGKSSNDKDD